jgi:hypothetical protein
MTSGETISRKVDGFCQRRVSAVGQLYGAPALTLKEFRAGNRT